VNGSLPALLVKLALALPVIPGQTSVAVNPYQVVSVHPAFCPQPSEPVACPKASGVTFSQCSERKIDTSCSYITLGNGDKVHVIGSVEEVSARLTAPQ